MNLKLKIWRQKNSSSKGELKTYPIEGVSPDSSFIEMLKQLNEELQNKGEEPVAFDCDCLEGICGTCSLMINGIAHGPERGTTTCQLHMRKFKDGDNITIEPWKARPFPIIKDLICDRSAFDRIVQKAGFVSVNTGGAPDANAVPISKIDADLSMDAAQCIGCGACVAACKNGSAMLFVSAQVAKYAHLPQGQPEKTTRVLKLVEQMDEEGFGNCTNQYECEAVCPKDISAKFIAELNQSYLKAVFKSNF